MSGGIGDNSLLIRGPPQTESLSEKGISGLIEGTLGSSHGQFDLKTFRTDSEQQYSTEFHLYSGSWNQNGGACH